MKMVKIPKVDKWMIGKNRSTQVVKRSKITNPKPFSEVNMNVHLIAALSAIGLGIMAFLAHRITRVAARKPILIENRRIVYRRRP
jgi:hypothetical protein